MMSQLCNDKDTKNERKEFMYSIKEMMIARVSGINDALVKRNADFQVRHISSFKNNECNEGYVLYTGKKGLEPVIYYNEKWWSISDDELAELLICYSKGTYINKSCTELKECLMNKEYILSHVLPRLYGENNIEAMRKHDRVYTKWLDMAVAYYIPVNHFVSIDSASTSVSITNELLMSNAIEIEELHDAAVSNMRRKTLVQSFSDILNDMMGICEDITIDPFPMLVISSKNGLNGAAGILCDNALKEVENILGDSFYILPSSIHECICLKEVNDEEYLHSMVCQINKDEIAQADKLTDSIYKYVDGKVIQVR